MTLKDHSSKHRTNQKVYVKMKTKEVYSIEEITQMDFTKLKQIGLVNEVRLRNMVIRHEYRTLMATGMFRDDAFEQLSEKFFLSPESIHGIVYKKEL